MEEGVETQTVRDDATDKRVRNLSRRAEEKQQQL
jgi:hypothetical protein